MDAQLEVTFIDCLDALAQGEPLERILARYPQDAPQLRPLLETAAALPALRMQPSEATKMKSRDAFLAQAATLRRTPARAAFHWWPRLAAGFAAVALIAMVLGTGTLAASSSALPGDPLYGLKRAAENVQLSAAASPNVRTSLQNEFAQRRRAEIGALLAAGRRQTVEFQGPIESLQPNAWIIDGLVVQIEANTQIVGTPQLNRMADVRGETGPAGLRASSISIGPGDDPTPTPTPMPQPAPTITPRPSATVTPAPATSALTVTLPAITDTPVPSATPRPTRTPAPSATETPQPVAIEFEGTVNSQDAETWIIDGAVITILPDTEILGGITVGQRVKVHALRLATGQLNATRIELLDNNPDTSNSAGGGGGSAGSNDNGGNRNDNSGNGNNENENNGNDNRNEDNHNDNSGNENSNNNSNENDH